MAKVDLNHDKVRRARDLDELARLLFPGNRNHQKTFLAVFVELKWAHNQFLPSLEPVAEQHGISPRTLETVRAKMRRLGLIDHVSRFNQKYGYREGWVFSNRFGHTLEHFGSAMARGRDTGNPIQEKKDRAAIDFL